jgi:hypothetical protein
MMEKRSFAWDENPHSGMLRLSPLSELLHSARAIQFDVPHARNGLRILCSTAGRRQSDPFDNSACEPDSHLIADVACSGLFSQSCGTIWPMMADCMHADSVIASGSAELAPTRRLLPVIESMKS